MSSLLKKYPHVLSTKKFLTLEFLRVSSLKKLLLCVDLQKNLPSLPFLLSYLYNSPPYGIFYFLFGDVLLTLKETQLSKLLMALSISTDLIKETCQPNECCLMGPWSYSPSLFQPTTLVTCKVALGTGLSESLDENGD